MSNDTLSTKLATLEANQKNMDKKLDDFIDVRFTKFEEKIDLILVNKADKSVVDGISSELKDLNTWKIRVVAYGSVILFAVTFFKDIIMRKLGF